LTADHLGSTRLVTDGNGVVKKCFDYLPYGEEIPNGYAGRTASCFGPMATYPASPDILGQKFTGKERDAETGLDYFGARYFSGAQGRFTTADPLMASARASNPQTWNRYAYTLNNPLRFVDPDGLEVPESCAKDSNCVITVKVNVIYDETVNKGKGLTNEQKKQFETEQLAKAKRDFGNSNIQLDVSYTAGRYDVGPNGRPEISGLRSDSLNLVVSDGTPTNSAGVSYRDPSGNAITIVNFRDVVSTNMWWPLQTNTTEHEFAHQFAGDVFLPKPNLFQGAAREWLADYRTADQETNSQSAFRQGVEPRRYAVPANPEANKPKK
jgi:RHS repeat-associated protein